MLLERSRDCGFSRCREAGEPDGEAGLLAECVALLAGEGRVPGDVAENLSVCNLVKFGREIHRMVGFGGALTLPFW